MKTLLFFILLTILLTGCGIDCAKYVLYQSDHLILQANYEAEDSYIEPGIVYHTPNRSHLFLICKRKNDSYRVHIDKRGEYYEFETIDKEAAQKLINQEISKP